MLTLANCSTVGSIKCWIGSVSRCHTFIVDAEVVLRQSDVAELVFRAPGAGKRRLVFVNCGVKPSESLIQLLFLLVQDRVSVDDGRHEEAASRRLSGHGDGAALGRSACQQQARATCVRQCQVLKGG